MDKGARFKAKGRMDSPAAIADHLTKIFETADDERIVQAIGTVALAHKMSVVAKDTGLSRENLYRTLKGGGNPQFVTVLKVLGALGMQLAVKPKSKDKRSKITTRSPTEPA
jgi:probable addiction module antidote protein